ncbi:unnamed protein product [Rhizophagus irregularis]|nr:unnamed protein product [Rhizophagus irregularis]
MSKKIDLSDIKELDINYIELDPVSKIFESDSNTIKSNKDTDISDKEEDSIAIFSRKTHIQEVHYATVPIEYPKTSEYGVAIIYNITDWKNPRDYWKNVKVVKVQLKTVHFLVILVLKKKKETVWKSSTVNLSILKLLI